MRKPNNPPTPQPAEPCMEQALGWWSELPAKWTPVGWADHLCRFSVLYNGMVSAIPDLNRRTRRWRGLGMQLGIWPDARPCFPGHVISPQDNGSVVQGWRECETPVLWSEWAQEGLVFRAEVFAHAMQEDGAWRGDEPLFAWLRLGVHDVVPALPIPESYGFNLLISAPYISTGAMSIRYNIALDPGCRRYPRELRDDDIAFDAGRSLLVLEPDGSVRLAVAPGQAGLAIFHAGEPEAGDFLIFLPLAASKGAHYDVLLPMIPCDRDLLERELALGFDGALELADAFWSGSRGSAATFQTPESHINQTIRRNLQLSRVVAERDPETGYRSLLTGAWAYADLWATPASMQIVMLLDSMGDHQAAGRYLQLFLDSQGSVLPECRYVGEHPGVLGPPKSVAACTWTSDHGAILWALASHALLNPEAGIASRFARSIELGCEFIRDARHTTAHPGVPGLMPPGIATDQPTHIQSVWADAWCYKGLATAARLLERIGRPSALEFIREARDYRTAFREAFYREAARMPRWTDDEGSEHTLAPTALYGAQDFEVRNAFYLDTGPLVLVFAGLLDADDPLMVSTLKWFREGPPRRVYRYDSDCWQVPSLQHEMSSCEPCFSWNLFHSHALGDRQHFLTAMYSLFAGAISRQTYTVCETRGGVSGLATATNMTYAARLAVVDDQIEPGELHLLRLFPLAWLAGEGSRFESLPTEFGPVSLRVSLVARERELVVEWSASFGIRPRRLVLHVPPVPGLRAARVNGRLVEWDRKTGQLDLQP